MASDAGYDSLPALHASNECMSECSILASMLDYCNCFLPQWHMESVVQPGRRFWSKLWDEEYKVTLWWM